MGETFCVVDSLYCGTLRCCRSGSAPTAIPSALTLFAPTNLCSCVLAAAMLGFLVAIATELTTQQSVWSQIAGEPVVSWTRLGLMPS